MPLSQIQFIIKNGNEYQIKRFLIDYFTFDKSPFLPLLVSFKVLPVDTKSEMNVLDFLIDWQIAEKSENENDASRQLARIFFLQYPAGLVLLFEFDEENRQKVTQITKIIQKKLIELGLEIANVIDNEQQPSEDQYNNPMQVIKTSEIEKYSWLNDIPRLKKIFRNYNAETAKAIILAIPKGYLLYKTDGGRWGPDKISKESNFNPTTIGRYLDVFRKLGIVKIDEIDLPIKMSHKNQ
jgi:hypothetical protein